MNINFFKNKIMYTATAAMDKAIINTEISIIIFSPLWLIERSSCLSPPKHNHDNTNED